MLFHSFRLTQNLQHFLETLSGQEKKKKITFEYSAYLSSYQQKLSSLFYHFLNFSSLYEYKSLTSSESYKHDEFYKLSDLPAFIEIFESAINGVIFRIDLDNSNEQFFIRYKSKRYVIQLIPGQTLNGVQNNSHQVIVSYFDSPTIIEEEALQNSYIVKKILRAIGYLIIPAVAIIFFVFSWLDTAIPVTIGLWNLLF